MENIPAKCENINEAGSFCDCIAVSDYVDPAVEAFCDRVHARDTSVTGDDLAELKKAVKDMEG